MNSYKTSLKLKISKVESREWQLKCWSTMPKNILSCTEKRRIFLQTWFKWSSIIWLRLTHKLPHNGCHHLKATMKTWKMMMISKQQDLVWVPLIDSFTQLENNKSWQFYRKQFNHFSFKVTGDTDTLQSWPCLKSDNTSMNHKRSLPLCKWLSDLWEIQTQWSDTHPAMLLDRSLTICNLNFNNIMELQFYPN